MNAFGISVGCGLAAVAILAVVRKNRIGPDSAISTIVSAGIVDFLLISTPVWVTQVLWTPLFDDDVKEMDITADIRWALTWGLLAIWLVAVQQVMELWRRRGPPASPPCPEDQRPKPGQTPKDPPA